MGTKKDLPMDMIVSAKAIALWPYMKNVVDRINEAAESGDLKAYNEVVADAGAMARRIRRVTTVKAMRVELRGMLWAYRREVRDMIVKRRHIARGVGKHGKTLSASTIIQYESFIRRWPVRRDEWKGKIRDALGEISALSEVKRKIYIRGGVAMRMIKGGQYPVRFQVARGDSWVGV